MPVVLLGRSIDDGQLDTVTIDNLSAGRQATNYLPLLRPLPSYFEIRGAGWAARRDGGG